MLQNLNKIVQNLVFQKGHITPVETNNWCNMGQGCYHHKQAPPKYPIKGYLVLFSLKQHRLLDWYTEHITQFPTHTIVVHRLNACCIVVTTNFGNFPKGKPFTEILGNIPLSSSSCCLDLNKLLPPLLMMFNIGSEMSIAPVTSLLSLVWKVKRILNVRLEKAPKEGVKVVHELVMKIIKAKKDEITFNGRKGGIDLLVRLVEGGRASGHGGESYNYKYDNGRERHHIPDNGVVVLVVIEAWRGRSVGCE